MLSRRAGSTRCAQCGQSGTGQWRRHSNVIPKEVVFKGTIRSHQEDVREQLWAEMERALKLGETLGGSYELEIIKGYPSLFNDKTVNDWMRDVAREMVGDTAVTDTEFGMGAEDFAYMAQQAKGAMFMLGAATLMALPATTTPRPLILMNESCPWVQRCWPKRPAAL